MPAPSIYLDECIDHALLHELRQRRFSATSVVDEAMAELDDEAQLTYTTAQDWILLSHNEKDFRRLHYAWLERGDPHGGILLVPQRPPLALLTVRTAMLLDWVGTKPSHRSRLIKWGQLQELLERGYRLPDYGDVEVQLALGRG